MKLQVARKPLFVKLTPNVTDIVSISRSAVEAGADGLCLYQHVVAQVRIRTYNGRGVRSWPTVGGFSARQSSCGSKDGLAVANACGVPVIGCGGYRRQKMS